jgi:hypothetical protein
LPESKRVVATLFAVLALGLGLSACGDDDGGSSAEGSQTVATPATTATEPPPADTTTRGRKGSSSDAAGKDASARGGSSASSGKDASDSKKVHGDGSIENFGDGASGEDSSGAIAAAEAFYAARAADDWKGVCDLMSSGIKEQLEQTFAQNPKLEGKGCTAVVPALVGGVPKPLLQQQADSTTFTEVRVKDDGAYVLFKSPTIPHGFLPMHQEDGDWKVAAIGGSSL